MCAGKNINCALVELRRRSSDRPCASTLRLSRRVVVVVVAAARRWEDSLRVARSLCKEASSMLPHP